MTLHDNLLMIPHDHLLMTPHDHHLLMTISSMTGSLCSKACSSSWPPNHLVPQVHAMTRSAGAPFFPSTYCSGTMCPYQGLQGPAGPWHRPYQGLQRPPRPLARPLPRPRAGGAATGAGGARAGAGTGGAGRRWSARRRRVAKFCAQAACRTSPSANSPSRCRSLAKVILVRCSAGTSRTNAASACTSSVSWNTCASLQQARWCTCTA